MPKFKNLNPGDKFRDKNDPFTTYVVLYENAYTIDDMRLAYCHDMKVKPATAICLATGQLAHFRGNDKVVRIG